MTTGGRRRTRCPERRKSQIEKNMTSTPTTVSSSSCNISILSYVEECDRKLSCRDEQDLEQEDVFPGSYSQQSRPKSSDEVYWNFDESPQTREALRRKLEASNSPLPLPSKPSQTVSTSRVNLVIKVPLSKNAPTTLIDEDGMKILNDLKELAAMQDETALVKTDDKIESSPSVNEKSDAFCSDDDSFLYKASQAVEATVVKQVPEKKEEEEEDPFGDDDGFDSLICQIDTDAIAKATAVKGEDSGVSLVSSKVGPRPVVNEPFEKKVQAVASFKRFKSADSVISQADMRNSPSGNIMKTWRRHQSSPEASKAAPPPPKCSNDEIEKKRQEALKRLRQKSQQQK